MIWQVTPEPATQAVIRPTWAAIPTAQQLVAVWPTAANFRPGSATISCRFTAAGALFGCKIASEEPVGVGFGTAALQVSRFFQLNPRQKGVQSLEGGTVNVPIAWNRELTIAASGHVWPGMSERIRDRMEILGQVRSTQTVSVLARTPFDHAPSVAEMAAAVGPLPLKRPAHLEFDCKIAPDGKLDGCEASITAQTDARLVALARALLPRFHVKTSILQAGDIPKLRVPVAFELTSRLQDPHFYVRQPDWLRQFSAQNLVAAYPQKALDAGVSRGKTTIECTVGPIGTLDGCISVAENPKDLGFGDAAVKVAPGMEMSVWTSVGEPVIGGQIRLPIQFVYGGEDLPTGASK